MIYKLPMESSITLVTSQLNRSRYTRHKSLVNDMRVYVGVHLAHNVSKPVS